MLDSHGIPGWDKVDQLASALLNLSGYLVSDRDADVIKGLYDNPVDYDKQHLVFHIWQVRPSQGKSGRTKRNYSGHATLDAVKR